MYNKLPIKERMDLMKSYRKANPDMSYRDMVNDYNTSYMVRLAVNAADKLIEELNKEK